MNKTAIKTFATWARNKLIADITYKAGLMGITEKGVAEPLPQSTGDMQFFDIGTTAPYSISGGEIAQRGRLVEIMRGKAKQADHPAAFRAVVEEVAYTWFNRLIAVRFMEVNDYLPSRVRVLSSEHAGKSEPDLVTAPFDAGLPLSQKEKERIDRMKRENQLDELFRMLFIRQCNALNALLPELFEETNDYSELLLNISYTDKEGVVSRLVGEIAADDFNVEKEGQVEIIGWLYQYYNTEPKQEVFDLLKKNVKITKERIPAATQLFTPDWIVCYMVENSLGRLWLERHPNEKLKSQWSYYVEEAEQDPAVAERLLALRAKPPIESPEDITFIDPCMGSGHILVYAFDVLMQIYESCGYNTRDAAKLIIEKNLHGLDIDLRAYQLAYFALAVKARQYNRRILTDGVKPQVYHPAGFPDGEEYGSLAKVDDLPSRPMEKIGQLSLDDTPYETQLRVWNFKRLLTQKYDVVCTNPPYMGSSGMNGKLAEFVKKEYPDSKSDLSTAFMERTIEMCDQNGMMAMINIPVWMFLSSYEKLREKIALKNTITSMVHFGRGVFGSDFGTTAFAVAKNHIVSYKGTYRRLFEKQGAVDSVEQKEKWFLEGMGHHTATADNFAKIPGMPIAYWVSEALLDAFKNGELLGSIAASKQGLATADNDRFLRLWQEISVERTQFNAKNSMEAEASGSKWFPYNKGGEFRKWYGNNDFLVNWEHDGQEIRNFRDSSGKQRSVVRNPQYYFHESSSWSLVSSGVAAFRYKPIGHIFDVAGMSFFSNEKLYYLLALCNTNVVMKILEIVAPTINYQCGDIANIPVISSNDETENIESVVEFNISLSRADWDSFETSWDFTRHPLIEFAYFTPQKTAEEQVTGFQVMNTMEAAYNNWKRFANEQFAKLKSNEVELNRIFINIYGLQDELTPDVADKDVTIARIYDSKDDIPASMKGNGYVLTKADVVKSLISYAVGCMFGRYSLDTDGLAYAGGVWDDAKYSSFIPVEDNILPITDEEYDENDVTGRFVQFVRTVYGVQTLEENLEFIAAALGTRGNSSREMIRGYFLKDFFKDHCKTYKKRPIYWLFDSGKADGFKALVYLHRYDENTIGNLRIDYLHRIQRVYDSEIARMQDAIENSGNGREVAAAEKRKEKLTKQLKESKDYDAKIAHLALARIAIDLDDGVKVNYEKVQTGTDGKRLDVLGKIG